MADVTAAALNTDLVSMVDGAAAALTPKEGGEESVAPDLAELVCQPPVDSEEAEDVAPAPDASDPALTTSDDVASAAAAAAAVVAAVVASIPANAAKKKAAKKKNAAASPDKAAKGKNHKGLQTSQFVVKAVRSCKDKRGASLAVIKKSMKAAGYDMKKNERWVKVAVRRLVQKGTLIGTIGNTTKVSASGCFKINNMAHKQLAAKMVANQAEKKKEEAVKAAEIAKQQKRAARIAAAARKALETAAAKKAAVALKPPAAKKKSSPKKARKPAAKKDPTKKSPKRAKKKPAAGAKKAPAKKAAAKPRAAKPKKQAAAKK